MYTISTLLFLVARRPSRIHIVSYYFSSIVELLLKLSTMCKSPLYGPCNYVDGVGTIRQLYFIITSRFFETSKIRFVSWKRKCKQEHSGVFMRVLNQRMEGRHRAKKGKILFNCITLLNLEELHFFIR